MPLRDYQLVGVEFLRERKRAALFLDMGLGKTAISLEALQPHMLPVLVVAPKRVAEDTWPEEVEKWRPDLSLIVATGGPAKRKAALASNADIVAIGRENLAEALDYGHKFKTFIMDEMSSFKTRSSNRWSIAKKITQAPAVEYVWGLTGTPSPNGLLDLWPQMYLLDRGKRLGKTLGGFRERYFTIGRQLPSGTVIEYDIRPGAEKRIHMLIQDICLSMSTEGRVKLPPVTYNYIHVPLPPKVEEAYKKFKRQRVLDMDIFGGDVRTAANAAVLSGKLSQLNAGFSYVDDKETRGDEYTVLHTDRVKVLQELIEGANGSPVLVFYRFQAEKEMILKALGKQAHTLDEPGVIPAWNKGKIPVLLAHPASAGHGLNLQYGGHTLVWASQTWSLEEYQQGNKRLARSGQQNPVVIHHLVTHNTVDDVITRVLEGKDSVQTALLDYLESPI